MSDPTASEPAATLPCLPGDAMEWLGVAPLERRVAAGETLFHRGQPTAGLYALRTGALRLTRCTRSGTPATMHAVRPGEWFAEASLFSEHYHCDAVALRASAVRLYPKPAVLQALACRPDRAWQFMAVLAHRLQEARQRIELRSIRSAPQRVLQFLQAHGDGEGRWRVDGTLKDWAEDLGLTHEVLYRTLASLEQAGMICRHGHALVLTAHRGAADAAVLPPTTRPV